MLLALPALDAPDRAARIGDAALPIVRDALRTNDTRLVAAALGPYAATHLDDDAWRQAVLKVIFMGIPVEQVAGLDRRSDAELARMVRDFAAEREAAGRGRAARRARRPRPRRRPPPDPAPRAD